jgi:cell division protein FtsN
MSDAELAASARAEDQRRAKAEARAQAALEGKPVPPASTPARTDGNRQRRQHRAGDRHQPSAAGTAERTSGCGNAAGQHGGVDQHRRRHAGSAREPRRPRPAPATAAPAPADNARYILQAGAFGASGDAEATKAKLAMMGLAARVESAQINGKTVYRVRMGPYGSAGELSEAKQKLDGTGLQAMAIKAQ